LLLAPPAAFRKMAGGKLTVVVTSCNVKKIDLKAYGFKKAFCQVHVKVNDKEFKTKCLPGLDPTFEETFEFSVEDENTVKCSASFFMGEEGPEQKQVGDTQDYILNLLKIGKPTFKGLIVPGGQVEMMFTAVGFGKEDVEEDTTADLLGLLDGGEGGMMMDDDEEEEPKK